MKLDTARKIALAAYWHSLVAHAYGIDNHRSMKLDTITSEESLASWLNEFGYAHARIFLDDDDIEFLREYAEQHETLVDIAARDADA